MEAYLIGCYTSSIQQAAYALIGYLEAVFYVGFLPLECFDGLRKLRKILGDKRFINSFSADITTLDLLFSLFTSDFQASQEKFALVDFYTRESGEPLDIAYDLGTTFVALFILESLFKRVPLASLEAALNQATAAEVDYLKSFTKCFSNQRTNSPFSEMLAALLAAHFSGEKLSERNRILPSSFL